VIEAKTKSEKKSETMKCKKLPNSVLTVLVAAASLMCAVVPSQAADKKPNIIFIMGDDIGWLNIGVYNQGMMAGRTPNLDRLATEGMRFTDYYAEAAARRAARTSSRASFQFVRASRRWAKPALRSECRPRLPRSQQR
jgi:hypothetical protein